MLESIRTISALADVMAGSSPFATRLKNIHWDSDVGEDRFIGAATVSCLHAEPTFLADVEAAKSELAAARAKNLAPKRDCKFDAAALAQTSPRAP